MEAKLLDQRQTFHVSIRTEKKNQNIQKRRNYFIENVLQDKVERVTEKVEAIKNMIVEGRIKEENIEQVLDELVKVLRHDSKMKDVGECIEIVLGYLINIYGKIKDQKNSEKNIDSILQVINNITYFVPDISPYERQIFAIAQQCMLKIAYKQQAILLLTNLSFFDFYSQMTSYMSSQQFFNSLLNVIEDLPLNNIERQNIIDFYTNLILDNNSNKTTLSKYITILYILIEYNPDINLSLKIIKSLKLLIRQNQSIVYEHDFEETIGIILSSNVETNDKYMKSQLLDLLRIVVKKSNPQLGKSLLDQGLFALIINCLQTCSQKQHNAIIRIMIQISYISKNEIEIQQKVELFFKIPLLEYIQSYYEFTMPQVKECILELIINFDITKIMNEPEFLEFLENFQPSKQTPPAQKNLLKIIESVTEKQGSEQTIVLHQMVIKVLQQLLSLENGDQAIKNETLRLLQYVQDKPQ